MNVNSTSNPSFINRELLIKITTGMYCKKMNEGHDTHLHNGSLCTIAPIQIDIIWKAPVNIEPRE